MTLLDQVAPAPRRVMTLFYVVDTSGSMAGEKLGSVNSAMEEAIQSDLPEISAANDDAEIKVAIMQFASGCSWITPASGPIGIGDVIWNDLKAGGLTDLGAACLELDKKLSRNEFLQSQTGAYAPVILLFSDGGPTDDWEKGLNQLKQNNWYKHAIKIAIAIGDDPDKNILAKFTGTPESVITVHDKQTLKILIKKVSVRASEFQSHSKQSSEVMTSAEEDSAAIAKEVSKDIAGDKAVTTDSGSIDVSVDSDWGEW
jgi:uncharacterized protein YegL